MARSPGWLAIGLVTFLAACQSAVDTPIAQRPSAEPVLANQSPSARTEHRIVLDSSTAVSSWPIALRVPVGAGREHLHVRKQRGLPPLLPGGFAY